MQNFQDELKIKSCFKINGIIAIDGVPKRKKYPNNKEKLKITEHHFLWIFKNPNLFSFSIFFYFYPIQVLLSNQKNQILKEKNRIIEGLAKIS